MIQTLSKQGGRRYGQMRNTGLSAVWLRSIGTMTTVFKAFWASRANTTVGYTIEPK